MIALGLLAHAKSTPRACSWHEQGPPGAWEEESEAGTRNKVRSCGTRLQEPAGTEARPDGAAGLYFGVKALTPTAPGERWQLYTNSTVQTGVSVRRRRLRPQLYLIVKEHEQALPPQ